MSWGYGYASETCGWLFDLEYSMALSGSGSRHREILLGRRPSPSAVVSRAHRQLAAESKGRL